MKNVKDFYSGANLKVLTANMLATSAIFVVSMIISPILISEYGYTEEIISAGAIALVIALSIGAMTARYLLSFKTNYFKVAARATILMAILQIAYIANAHLLKIGVFPSIEYLFIPLRFIEGLSLGIIMGMLGYVMRHKLASNKSKGGIEGLLRAKGQTVRLIMPILSGATVTITEYGLSLYVASFMLYISAAVYLLKNQKTLFQTYYRYIAKNFKAPTERLIKFKLEEALDFSFLRENKNDSIDTRGDNLMTVIQGMVRTVDDLYLLILLTVHLGLGVFESSLVLSALIMGMVLSAWIGFMYDKICNSIGEIRYKYHSTPLTSVYLVISLLFSALYFFNENISDIQMFIATIVLALIWGMNRAIWQDWKSRRDFAISKKYSNINNIGATTLFYTDIGLVLGYGTMIVLYTAFGIKGFLGFFISIPIMMGILHFMYFRNRVIKINS